MTRFVLAIDQGTTGTTVLVTTPDGTIHARGYREHPQHFPAPGLVEHDPEAIWQTVIECTHNALAAASIQASDIAAVGITNQRETLVPWDAETGRSIGRTIVWQDRRTAARCEALIEAGRSDEFRRTTGLPIDPYFSGTKAEWLLLNDSDVQAAAAGGTLRLGTIDSWLVYRLSGGRAHVTDASNASRTLLFDIHRGAWSEDLCAEFGVDPAWLPRVVDSSGHIADVDPNCLPGVSAPISGIAGDQQSALFGQACLSRGSAKATYGTGAFVLVNNGGDAPASDALLSTIAWRLDGATTYALEGSVFTAGASVQWLRDGLEIIENAREAQALAETVSDTAGVVLVPAFAGLGAPHWDPDARGAMFGLTRGTTRAHVARATLEAITFRVRQVIDAMGSEGTRVAELHVDGGAAANDLLLQLQADILGVPVTRPKNIETTGLGAAHLAALGAGLHDSLDDVATAWAVDRVFEPRTNTDLEERFARFERGVTLVRELAHPSTALRNSEIFGVS